MVSFDLRTFSDNELFDKLKDTLRTRPELSNYFTRDHVEISEGLEDILEQIARIEQRPLQEKGAYSTPELRLLKGIYHELKDRDRQERVFPGRLGDFGKTIHTAYQFYNIRFPYGKKREDDKNEDLESESIVA